MKPDSGPGRAHCVGVLGGMGPLAGATYILRLVRLTPAARDQDHISAILVNDPSVPDRTAAQLAGGPSPLPSMIRGIETLVKAGADCIAIPCNTAHLWFDELQKASSIPLLNIVAAVIQDLQRHDIHHGTIGILGTPATIKFGLYQKGLGAAGYTPIVPDPNEIQRLLVPAIAAVKANQLEAAYDPVVEVIHALKQKGAQAIVLGCTELPLAVPQERRAQLGIVLTDSIDALALSAIDWIRNHTDSV